MKGNDLTHTISEDMTVFPGSETPKLTTKSTYEKDMLNIVWRLIITYLMDIEAFQI